jgi:6-phosphogluconolactonase
LNKVSRTPQQFLRIFVFHLQAQLLLSTRIRGGVKRFQSYGWTLSKTNRRLKRLMRKIVVSLAITIVLGLAASSAALLHAQDFQPGAVFIMTNASNGNEVISFSRAADGSLVEQGHFATGGRGSGGDIDPLHSQGSLVLSDSNRVLFAVNAGSGDISLFRVHGAQLQLAQVITSGGTSPVAVAARATLVYALNAGPNPSVVGFRVRGDGNLTEIGRSPKQLSNSDAAPSGLAISPDGQVLAVTERNNNLIDSFRINSDGTLGPIVSAASSGPSPFSIEFAPSGALLTTEAANAAISSYAIQANGALATIEGSISTAGAAACWHVITPNGRFVYISNAGSSTIAGFAIGPNGSLTPLGATVVATLPAGSTNLDIATSQDGKFLYTLNAGAGAVGIFSIQRDGTLLPLGTAGQFAAAAGENGIAAF